jgi:hypothetical protein
VALVRQLGRDGIPALLGRLSYTQVPNKPSMLEIIRYSSEEKE